MEPCKNVFNKQLVKQMAAHLHTANTSFDTATFRKLALRDLENLELKELTRYFSSECAVRPLIIADTERALRHINNWAYAGVYLAHALGSCSWLMQLAQPIEPSNQPQ